MNWAKAGEAMESDWIGRWKSAAKQVSICKIYGWRVSVRETWKFAITKIGIIFYGPVMYDCFLMFHVNESINHLKKFRYRLHFSLGNTVQNWMLVLPTQGRLCLRQVLINWREVETSAILSLSGWIAALHTQNHRNSKSKREYLKISFANLILLAFWWIFSQERVDKQQLDVKKVENQNTFLGIS